MDVLATALLFGCLYYGLSFLENPYTSGQSPMRPTYHSHKELRASKGLEGTSHDSKGSVYHKKPTPGIPAHKQAVTPCLAIVEGRKIPKIYSLQ